MQQKYFSFVGILKGISNNVKKPRNFSKFQHVQIYAEDATIF